MAFIGPMSMGLRAGSRGACRTQYKSRKKATSIEPHSVSLEHWSGPGRRQFRRRQPEALVNPKPLVSSLLVGVDAWFERQPIAILDEFERVEREALQIERRLGDRQRLGPRIAESGEGGSVSGRLIGILSFPNFVQSPHTVERFDEESGLDQ